MEKSKEYKDKTIIDNMDKYNILKEYRDKIIYAIDYEDAKSIAEIASTMADNIIEKNLIDSLVFQNRYNKKMELDKFMLYINIIANMNYYNDAMMIIGDIEILINDNAQINTLKRLVKNKPTKHIGDSLIKHFKDCPHCGRRRIGVDDSDYVVCGYTNRGYDWKGCGKDWCFKCGKKLCKSWNTNQLYNKANRYHNAECCKNHASKHGLTYKDNYCECSNECVNRIK
jgi:hypothetical protein